MVFAGDDDVLHPSIHGNSDPFICFTIDGVEPGHEALIDVEGDLGGVTDPFTMPGALRPLPRRDAVQTPVDEHPEACLVPPLHSRIVVASRFGATESDERRFCAIAVNVSALEQTNIRARRTAYSLPMIQAVWSAGFWSTD